MILLAAALAQEIEQYNSELDRFHTITETGSLSTEEIDAVANAVWGDQVSYGMARLERSVWFDTRVLFSM